MSLLCVPIATATIINEVNDERLEEIYSLVVDSAQLLDNGRRFETVTKGAFQCALGKNSYLSGTHLIRVKRHYDSAFIGFRSCHIPVETDIIGMAGQYQDNPSTYGWYTKGIRMLNGICGEPRLKISKTEAIVFELTLHCDERRLTMATSDDTSVQDEIRVDELYAPFPWCLVVQLNRIGACMSLE